MLLGTHEEFDLDRVIANPAGNFCRPGVPMRIAHDAIIESAGKLVVGEDSCSL